MGSCCPAWGAQLGGDLDGLDGGGGWVEGPKEGEDICIHILDSFCCTAESNTIVEQLYTNYKIK